jgi:hypothetical protein
MVYTFCRSILLQSSTCLGLRASWAATCIQSIQLFDLEFTGYGTLLLGRFSKYPSRTFFVPFKCGSLATEWICWHCHRQILPAIITTLRSGANSAWATVFGRLLSIVCGNIVPFKIREPAFVGFSAHAQHILICCTYIFSTGDRISEPFESVSGYFARP